MDTYKTKKKTILDISGTSFEERVFGKLTLTGEFEGSLSNQIIEFGWMSGRLRTKGMVKSTGKCREPRSRNREGTQHVDK